MGSWFRSCGMWCCVLLFWRNAVCDCSRWRYCSLVQCQSHLANDTVSHLGRPKSTATLLLQASNIARDFCNCKPFFFFVFIGILKLKYVQVNGCNRSSGAWSVQLISNFCHDLNIVYVLLGISLVSNCSWPTFRKPVSVPSSKAGCSLWGVRRSKEFYPRVRVLDWSWPDQWGMFSIR